MNIPALDFAGGTVVHISSGVSALICALVLGKRAGFGRTPMPPHSVVLSVIGAAMLWVGWFGFNGGSALGANGLASNAFTATHFAAAAGAHVTHVDSAKGVVTWARYKQQLSGLEKLPIRWIVDDAVKFVQRDHRRNKRYDIIILDPPAFGRGPKNEIWKIEDQLLALLADCRAILSDAPLFVLLTMYSINQSALLLGNLLQDMMRGAGGTIEVGELCLKPKASPKLLAMSHFGRWSARNYKD
jgi:hypothetical protein